MPRRNYPKNQACRARGSSSELRQKRKYIHDEYSNHSGRLSKRTEIAHRRRSKGGVPLYGKVEGDSMIEAGICNGDIAVIDRSIEPRDGDVVVGYINEEFTIKYLDLSHRQEGYIELRPANSNFKPIRIDEDDAFEVWGVVVWTIKNWRKY